MVQFDIFLPFKILFMVLLLFYILYNFLLVVRVRILGDTVQVPFNSQAKMIALIHLIMALVVSVIAILFVLAA